MCQGKYLSMKSKILYTHLCSRLGRTKINYNLHTTCQKSKTRNNWEPELRSRRRWTDNNGSCEFHMNNWDWISPLDRYHKFRNEILLQAHWLASLKCILAACSSRLAARITLPQMLQMRKVTQTTAAFDTWNSFLAEKYVFKQAEQHSGDQTRSNNIVAATTALPHAGRGRGWGRGSAGTFWHLSPSIKQTDKLEVLPASTRHQEQYTMFAATARQVDELCATASIPCTELWEEFSNQKYLKLRIKLSKLIKLTKYSFLHS